MMKPKISDVARGKWPSILAELGVDKKFLSPRHGPCPACAGLDRFRFDDKGDGRWYCNQCGAGDGIGLLQKIYGWDFRETAREVERVAGAAKTHPIRTGPSIEDVKREMNAAWKAGKPLRELDPTYRWWDRRVGFVPDCPDLRGVARLRCPGAGDFPAMVALIRDREGKAISMHRTFINVLGDKANVPEPRMVMPMPMKGGAVRLTPPASTLGIAEGIETAVSATVLFDIPCWAALNAQNLQEWAPPDGVTRVMVFGDHDRSLTGHAASYTLAKKLLAKKLEVEVCIPARLGFDWNDELQSRRRIEGVDA
ncbi:toprim domain-containing protein [Phenylobacterium sp. LjRoot164]|uniref:toprim domain-containing protein n=1 Tax=unclassified Phenylobacterium TaxID=2640670 RepID=UPI003ECF033E